MTGASPVAAVVAQLSDIDAWTLIPGAFDADLASRPELARTSGPARAGRHVDVATHNRVCHAVSASTRRTRAAVSCSRPKSTRTSSSMRRSAPSSWRFGATDHADRCLLTARHQRERFLDHRRRRRRRGHCGGGVGADAYAGDRQPALSSPSKDVRTRGVDRAGTRDPARSVGLRILFPGRERTSGQMLRLSMSPPASHRAPCRATGRLR